VVVLFEQPSAPSREELGVYVHSDYMTETERETEADVPVPDRLLPKRQYQRLVSALRLSQKIGILIWLNREGLLSLGGKERLLYLQEKASFEALSSGLEFAQRLSREKKLQSDFMHQMRELNRRPQSKHYRQSEGRRIGVGYRDKGTLPGNSHGARLAANEEAFIPTAQLPEALVEVLARLLPACLTEDGMWIDLSEFSGPSGPEGLDWKNHLLHPL
jgi:hypothetical protein